MKTTEKLHQIHLNEWAALFSDQKANDLTVKQWCEKNNFSTHAYNYWKHLLKKELANQVLPDIVPIAVPESIAPITLTLFVNSSLTNCTNRATAKLPINDISLEFHSSISEEFLCTIIKAMRYA